MLDRYRSCFCSITLIQKKGKTESKQRPMAPNSHKYTTSHIFTYI